MDYRQLYADLNAALDALADIATGRPETLGFTAQEYALRHLMVHSSAARVASRYAPAIEEVAARDRKD